MRFLQTILKLSLKLSSKSYQDLSRLIHAKDILGFLFITVQAWLYYSKLQFSIVRKILVLYIILLVFQMDMLYMNCVCILKACFKQINDSLANLRELVKNGEPYLLSDTYHGRRNPFLLMEIIALKKQHLAISDTVRMLKMVFSLQLLTTTVMTFIQITFNLYFYLVRVKEGVSVSNLERQTYYEYFITSVTYYFTKIVLIVWACETGKNQAMEIGSTIHNVFNSSSNKQIKYELQLFSLQLLHCKNIFSAKGLTVDATLLTAIVGGITTYLLILIQFLVMSHSCDGKLLINLTDII
ncbi:PREDICTED: putative gustatory receptor 28b [Vollenhovia emeryi]|uniref:putative gustatory receptor 28b n=1 Tax=Vollenhovia emeryi TaxID=411798 RepID=UPI0005F58C53|nr:PREDICTED: putative gustatory receptor 28b [Vollenhovia emeryi]